MFITRKEYNAFEDRIHKLEEKNKAVMQLSNEKIDELIGEISQYRYTLRQIHKLIKKERGVQNYGSVENALNKLEREIDKVEIGE